MSFYGPIFVTFGLSNNSEIFTTNKCKKLSIQFPVSGFKLTAS